MKIVYYDEQYLTPCAEIFTTHYNNTDFNCNFTTTRASTYLEELIYTPRFIGFILLEQAQVIGFALCHLRTWDTTDELIIDEFIIQSEHQKKGLGSKLLEFIDTYAQNLHLAGVTTTTNIIGLTQFYQKNDFLEHDITFLYKGLIKTA